MSKADEPAAPTEEQIEAANEAVAAEWQGDFDEADLSIPYKREETKEEPKSEDEPAEAEPVEEPNEEADEPVEVYSDPAPVVTVEDPGEYVPKDYSFQVTLADGKTKTIKTPEEAEKLAEDPENFETPKQLLDFINKTTKMTNKLEKDKEAYEAQKQKFDEQTAELKQQQETVSGYASEFQYLADKGLIPKLSEELQTADWRDPEVAKNKDVKVYNDILDYLVKENKVRAKNGVKPITSIVDAFNAWQLENNKRKAEDTKKAAGEARRAAGSRVAGVSPAQQTGYVPKGIAVGNPNVFKNGASVWDD